MASLGRKRPVTSKHTPPSVSLILADRVAAKSHANCKAIWRIANERSLRQFSQSTKPIPWNEHRIWYQAKIRDPQCYFYLIFSQKILAGYLRFEQIKRGSWLTSIGLSRQFRGQGIAQWALITGSRRMLHREKKKLTATIHERNLPSRALFETCGFKRRGRDGSWIHYYRAGS